MLGKCFVNSLRGITVIQIICFLVHKEYIFFETEGY